METILFLIIAGILSSIFSKAKGKSNPGRTKPFTVKGSTNTQHEQQMTNNPRKPGRISIGQPVVQESNLSRSEDNYREVKLEPVVPIKHREQVMKSSVLEVDSDKLLEKPDEKAIINGIIWAEILGEPRAKKPHFSEKR